MIHKSSLTYALLLMLMLLQPAEAGVVDEIISTSPSWATFTNPDGTGLYHEILREVFGLYGIPVRHEYAKSNRSKELVRLGLADMMTCDDMADSPLTLARYPLYTNDFYVFFSKKRIGKWKGAQSLWGKEVLSQPGYYSKENFPTPVNIKEVMTGVQGVSMILMDRSDFYVEDLILMNQSLEENTISYNKDDFAIERVGQRAYFPMFNTTERGREIMKMYDDGMLRLHRQGKLKPIYEKWGYQYPDFDAY